MQAADDHDRPPYADDDAPEQASGVRARPLTYGAYQRLDELLACKQPLTGSADEDLFIAVHQMVELAFHQMRTDLERALEALATAFADGADPVIGDTTDACYFLRRAAQLFGAATRSMTLLADMRAFDEFRETLGGASGFQSVQFRHIQILAGVPPYWRNALRDEQGKPSCTTQDFEAEHGAQVDRWLARHRDGGHDLRSYYGRIVSLAGSGDRAAALARLASHRHAAPLLRQLAAFERAHLGFHRAHREIALAQLRRLGIDRGTGGSCPAEYLSRYEREHAPLFAGLTKGPEEAES